MAIRQFILKNKNIISYSISLGLLLFLLKWLELKFLIFGHALEIYIGLIALVFTVLGIWLAMKLTRRKKETIIVEKPVYISHPNGFTLNEKALMETGLSKRELEVLQQMAEGLSNEEIAGRLFVSLSTVKTHTSKLFEKLEVKRRTQAVEKAKRLGLIP
jgi:two-component system, NarL family, response regulator LiaR